MALLLAEERFLKIKQAVEEEQNQPEVMQELLLKLMNDLQILKGIQPKQAEQEEQAAKKDIQELMSKLLEDVGHINEELSEFINSPSWNCPTFYNDDDEYTILYRKHKAITPDLPIEEPDNSLSMGDEHLNTIPETEKSSVENLVPIPINVNLLVDKIEALKLTPSIPFMLENPSFSPIPIVDSDFLMKSRFLSIRAFTFDIEPDAPVINNFDELNEDECFNLGGGEINVEDDDSFTFVIRTFLPYRTYPVDSPLLLSTGSEDTIFDPDIST
ncbi:hypothetical protein Tco_0926207 [Tanacetum coccineum]|uniref:Uncharacterized protein n=1 Tax=Tanacetum coccineum TaxID=301880 RepID=A0ABQ5DBX6_9ASTR